MKFRKFSKTIQIRLLLQFLTVMATMSVSPYIVLFFAARLGTVVTGFMFLGVMAASIIGSFLGGYLGDRIGRKKVIVRSEFIVFIGFALIAMVNSPWVDLPYITFILFLVVFLSTGTAGPSYQALLIDESNADNRRAVYTFSYWLNNLGVAIGGVVGAFLFKDYHFYLFIGVSFVTLVSLIITMRYIKDSFKTKVIEPTVSDEPKKRFASTLSFFSAYKETWNHKPFTALAFANLLVLSVEEQLTNFIGIRLAKDMSDPESIVSFLPLKVDGINMLGILKTENTILVVTLTVIISFLLKKLKDRSVLLAGIVLYFTGYIIISFNSTPLVLIAAMFLATLGELMHIPVKQALLANMVPDHARTTFMATYGLMSIFGAVIAGLFIFASGVIPTHMVSISFFVIGIITFTIFSSLTKKEQPSTLAVEVKI